MRRRDLLTMRLFAHSALGMPTVQAWRRLQPQLVLKKARTLSMVSWGVSRGRME